LNLGQAYALSGDTEAARQRFEAVLQLSPAHGDAMFNLGVLALNRDQLEDAHQWFSRVVAQFPGYCDAYVNLGIVLQKQGDLSRAIACFRQAITLDPELTAAHFNLGQAYNAEGRMDEAAACYRNTLTLQPEHGEARWALTVSQIPAVYESEDELERRRAAFSTALYELAEWFGDERIAEGYRAVGVVQPFLLAYQEKNNRPLLQQYGELCARLMSHWFDRQKLSRKRVNAAG
jgi:Tfp pilus assembly protein PilF